ncbi:SDR family NAD(P)-dependent oxidoreductase [Succinatimonas hippei]|uniref:type I polyketide synthase n=1 Tax=Succinatimonas hippei TaxID=626938 RepID=UPI0020132CD2|nr:type I polyketide synthase [Succinatimonas hippei]MCL1603486.1 SDR family NAD(P)-dependent oxidoreductase [Succinatimonas hippei]
MLKRTTKFITYSKDAVAVIGVGCRFPGGISRPDELWHELESKKDLIGEVSQDRFSVKRFVHPSREVSAHSVTFDAGICSDVRFFDANFFKMSKNEAQSLDPQQRMALEMSLEAIESAGIKPSVLSGSNTSVFIGAASTDMAVSHADDAAAINAYSMLGTNLSIISNRLSYFYDLHGESMTIDTACSSSLTALHKACQSLRLHESSLSLAGGVNILLSPLPFIGFSKAHMLSSKGRCQVFSDEGDGYVRSEGGAIVLLKRLDDALKDGDPILGVIENSALNQDGRTNGISLPNVKTQAQLLSSVYSGLSYNLEDLVYVEAHGTGTKVGDPIECESIGSTLGLGLKQACGRKLLIGSIKSNIGHLETASGMAGLLKSLLILKYKKIPANLYCEHLNQSIDFDSLNLSVVKEEISLPVTTGPAMIGVNSFGFGGANAHIVLREFKPEFAKDYGKNVVCHHSIEKQSVSNTQELKLLWNDSLDADKSCSTESADSRKDAFSLYISAASKESLQSLAKAYAKKLFESDAKEVCSSAYALRDRYAIGLFAHAKSKTALHKALLTFAQDGNGVNRDEVVLETAQSDLINKKVVFVFSGNGSQYIGMGVDLYHSIPVFADFFRQINNALLKYQQIDLLDFVCKKNQEDDLSSPAVVQPYIFAFELAFALTLKYYGIIPNAVCGHSVGEVAAACFCGALSIDDAAKVIVARSRCQSMTSTLGGMAAVKLDANVLTELLSDTAYKDICIAAENAPDSFTLSGPKSKLKEFSLKIKEHKGAFKLLNLNYAFHSNLMDPIKEELLASLNGIKANSSQIAFFSTVSGDEINGTELNEEYWWQNIRQSVKFKKVIAKEIDFGCDVFIEIGPRPILGSYIKQIALYKGALIANEKLSSGHLAEGKEFIHNLLRLFARGLKFEASRFFDLAKVNKKAELPLYPFSRQIYWTEPSSESFCYFKAQEEDNLLGFKLNFGNKYLSYIDDKSVPFLQGHKVQGRSLMPFAAFLQIFLKLALLRSEKAASVRLENLFIDKSLDLSGQLKTLVTECDARGEITLKARDFASDAFSVIGHCRTLKSDFVSETFSLEQQLSSWQSLDVPKLYLKAKKQGIEYSGNFVSVQQAWKKGSTVCALLNFTKEDDNYCLSVSGLDGALQLLFFFEEKENLKNDLYLPSSVQEVQLNLLGANISKLFAFFTIKSVGSRSIVADIVITDELYNVKIKLKACRYIKVAKPEAQKVHLYTQNWQAVPSFVKTRSLVDDIFIKDITNSRVPSKDSSLQALCTALICALVYEQCVQKDSYGEIEEIFGTLIDDKQRGFALFLLNLLVRFDYAELSTNGFCIKGTADLDKKAIFNALLSSYPDNAVLFEFIVRIGENLKDILSGEKKLKDLLVKQDNVLERLNCLNQQKIDFNYFFIKHLQELLSRLKENTVIRIVQVCNYSHSIAPFIYSLCDFSKIELCLLASNVQVAAALRLENENIFANCKVLMLDEFANEQSFDLVISENIAFSKDYQLLIEQAVNKLLPAGVLVDISNEFDYINAFINGAFCELFGCKDEFTYSVHGLSKEALSLWIDEIGLVIKDSVKLPDLSLTVAQKKETGAEVEESYLISMDKTDVVAVCLNNKDENCEYLNNKRYINLLKVSDSKFLSLKEVEAQDVKKSLLVFELRDIKDYPLAKACFILTKLLLQAKNLGFSKIIAVLDGKACIKNILNGKTLTSTFDNSYALSALLRTALVELSLNNTVIMVGNDSKVTVDALMHEILFSKDSINHEVLICDDRRFVLKANLVDDANFDIAQNSAVSIHQLENKSLEFDFAGKLSSLRYKKKLLPTLKSDEVLIETAATALNFRDVMWASGLLPDEALESGFAGASLGLECSGYVVACGSDVSEFTVGDEVIALGSSCFSDYVVTKANAVFKKPQGIDLLTAAGIGVVFFTAYYSLVTKAQAQAGEKILIHAAAGGVGLAAIEIAKSLGLEIYATAGSEYKRALLRNLGINHIYNSRDLGFYDEIKRDTKGQGVDIVLNSLSGDAAALSLLLLKPLGRFIELGKRDFYADNPLFLKAFKDNLTYIAVDADELLRLNLQQCKKVFYSLLEGFNQEIYSPIPCELYPQALTKEAFNALRSGNNFGKLIIVKDKYYKNKQDNSDNKLSIDKTKTKVSSQLQENGVKDSGHKTVTVISGGLGGVGFAIAQNVAQKGDSALVLIGRKPKDDETVCEKISLLKTIGCKRNSLFDVIYVSCDLSLKDELFNALDKIFLNNNIEINDFYHCSGILDDKLLSDLDESSFAKVIDAKYTSALNFFTYVKEHQIKIKESFLFSSATVLFGNAGQGNYVAANAALETLADRMRAEGYQVHTIGWGPISDVGMLKDKTDVAKMLERRIGTPALNVYEVLDALEQVKGTISQNLYCFKARWQTLSPLMFANERFSSLIGKFKVEKQEAFSDFKTKLQGKSAEDVFAILGAALIEEIAKLTGTDKSSVNLNSKLADLGMDSLSLMELVLRLEELLDMKLDIALFASCSTLFEFTKVLVKLCQKTEDSDELLVESMEKQHGVHLKASITDKSVSGALHA